MLLTIHLPRLALANWLRNSDISVLLIDKKPYPTPRGQAEGLKSTTVEIFESFGIGPQIATESWPLEEIAIWGPRKGGDGAKPTGIVREQVIQDKVEELGKTRETMLQQGMCRRFAVFVATYLPTNNTARVEHHMLENLLQHKNIKIRRSTVPVALDINANPDQDIYPVKVRLEKHKESETEAAASNVRVPA